MNLDLRTLAPLSAYKLPSNLNTDGMKSIGQITPLDGKTTALPLDGFYFSNASTRARLDRFLREDAPARLMFDFVETPDQQPRNATHAALSIEHKQSPNREPIQDADALDRSTITIRRIDYNPVVDGLLLSEAMKLNYAKLVTRQYEDGPNVVRLANGNLLTKDDFGSQGIEKVTRSWAQEALQRLKQVLDHPVLGGLLSKVVRIEDSETLVVLNRWRFNPVSFWTDKNGQTVQPFHLVKLPNGVIGDVQKASDIQTFDAKAHDLSDAGFRTRVKDGVLKAMDDIEQQGYSLLITPKATPLDKVDTPEFLPVVPSENPFAHVRFAGTTKRTDEKSEEKKSL